MMLTPLLQIGSLMSRTTFCEKLKVDENGDFSWKSESWCSPLCSKLAYWWAGPLFVKSWKSLKMAIFHEKVSHDAHLFAPNWLTDEQDHFLWKLESWWKWRFFMKKWVMMLTSLLQIGSLMSRTTFCEKLKVTQNGDFSWKSESWCSLLCSKLAHWWAGPLFVKSWKSLKMAIFHEKVSHDAHLFAPNWLTDEQDHFLSKVESHSKWRFFMKKWVMMLTSLLQIGSLMSRTTFCEKLKVDENGDFSWKSESWCSPLCSKLAHWWAGPLFVKSWKSLKMAIFHEKVSHDAHLFAPNCLTDEQDHFLWKVESHSKWRFFHEKVSHDAHLFAPNWLTDEQDHFLWKFESWWKWRFFMKKWVMMLTSLLQIGSLMSRTTFCEKLKVDENGDFSWKSESWCSPLCSKLAHWWAGPLFVKSWKSLKMAIFHEKVSHDAHLFAPNWLTDEQDHFLWKVESHSKWRFFMKKWVMMLTSLLQIGSLMSRTTFCEKLKVDENGDFSWKSESWCSPLCSKLAHWWAGPLFVKSWKFMKMAIFHEKVSHDAHLFAPNWLTNEHDHFLLKVESHSKWRFFMKKWVMMLTSLLQIGSLMSRTTFCEKLKVTQNGDFSWKSESWCSPLCSKLAHWWAGPLFVKSWKLMKMAIFHEKVSHDAHLFAPNWLTDEQDHFLWKVESHSKWRFFMKKWVMMLTSLLQIGSLMSRTTFCEKLKVDENGDFSWKSESWCSPLCSKLAHWWAGPLFVKSWKSLKMAIFHEKVSHDAHLFAPNWLTDEQDHFLWKFESWWKWRFFMKKWVMMLTSLLQIGSLMSRTTFCEKLKVDENGDFSWKSESWCSPLCSKLAHWWAGPLFVKSWKSLKMAIFHEKVSHDAHLFAPNWLTDEQDHFLWKVESHSKWRFFMKKWVMMLTSLLQIGSLMSRTTFCEKLKVDENGNFSWKSESWCSPLCSKLAHWWAGPLFLKSWKFMKMAIFMKKWVMMLTSLLQIGSLMSRTTFCEKLKVTQNGDFSWKSESWCSLLCSKLAHWWAGPLFVKSWKSLKMAIFHEKVSHDAHLFAPNRLTDEQDHFLWKVESHSKWRFFMKKWVMMLTSLLQIGSLMSRTTFCEKLKVTQNGDFSWKSESWCSPLCSKLAHWWAGPLFVKS